MMIRRIKVSGLLSFGPQGIDLSMEPLNVLIGSNGSGKSNLLEVLGLLRAAPRELAGPIKRGGGVWEWLWKGDDSPGKATLEAVVNVSGEGGNPLLHELEFTDHGGLFEVTGERIEPTESAPTSADAGFRYRLHQGHHTFDLAYGPEEEPRSWPSDTLDTRLNHERSRPEESVLSQIRDAKTYPEMNRLQDQYEHIRLYRNWSFGPESEWRRNQSAHDRPDFLNEGGANLALVLSHFQGPAKRQLLKELKELFDGIVDVNCPVTGGTVSLFLEERGGRQIPASRLSDGTLRYLCLLAVLLHPDPPSLVAIEEPELGLHPDVVAKVAELLVDASRRMQIVVTTHSHMLVDALSDCPSSIVVCEQENGESRFERLDGERLRRWLDQYSLGDLWSSGELGGNRW